MFEYFWDFTAVVVFLAVAEAAVRHKKNREMIETLCIEESPWKTFVDNCIVNFLVLTPFISGFWVISLIVEVFSS